MIKVVDGEIYHLYAETEKEALEASRSFFESGNHENDLVAINGLSDDPIYMSKNDVECGMIGDDCYVYFTWRVFRDARNNRHLMHGGVIPALNELGEPVCLLKINKEKAYFHDYKIINRKPDTRVFSLYDIVVLMNEVTEYSFLLLKDALADYSGRIFCIGPEWLEFQRFFSGRNNIEYVNRLEDIMDSIVGNKTMYLKEFGSYMAGWKERCEMGFFSYDEIMSLVYFFSIHKSYGTDHPEKKYYLIGPDFPMEGLMSICNKVQLPYAYAEANGFIPVIRIFHSYIYSDFQGDDIWEKFFEQPYGKEVLEWQTAQNVYEFPLSSISVPARWLMGKIIECKNVQLVNTFLINERVKEEIGRIRNDVLPDPERTIGVLIRGTDYTTTHLPGHQIMASPEQVFEKIKEFERGGNYDQIFLSTEDEDILQTMKKLCGDRLRFIDQKRFRIQPGELLADQAKERENEGWFRGKEYLTTLQLLSECASFIASGRCCGTTCVMNTGGNHFKETFIFELGVS